MADVPQQTRLTITKYSVDSMLVGGNPIMGLCDASGTISTGVYGVVNGYQVSITIPQDKSPSNQDHTLFINSGALTNPSVSTLTWTYEIVNGMFVFVINATSPLGTAPLWKSAPQSQGTIIGMFGLSLNAQGNPSLTKF